MTVAVGLLVYSVVMMVAAPPLLGALTRGGSAPRFGVAAWLTAIVSVMATWIAIPALVVLDLVFHDGQRGSVLASCVQVLCDIAAGRKGTALQVAVAAPAVALVVVLVGVGLKVVFTIRRLHAHARDHAQAVRLVGRPTGQPHVFLVEAGERTAYCVAGRPPAIVVTRGAVTALNDDELHAVLAHERAHLAGRHLTIVTALRGVAMVFPRLRLMTRAVADVTRLLEMCADDAASSRYGHHTLLAGLMALAGATPVPALGAADVALMNRAERLALPPAPRTRIRARAGLCGAMTLIALAPVATFVLATSGPFCS